MERVKEALVKRFFKDRDIASLYLFGSCAKGTDSRDSDIDLAILFNRDRIPDEMALIALKEDISDLLHKEVDLISLNKSSPIIGMQVIKHGILLLNNRPKENYNYVMKLFTDYMDLKKMREPMEMNILKRKYYG